jgi:hypothetical protein
LFGVGVRGRLASLGDLLLETADLVAAPLGDLLSLGDLGAVVAHGDTDSDASSGRRIGAIGVRAKKPG